MASTKRARKEPEWLRSCSTIVTTFGANLNKSSGPFSVNSPATFGILIMHQVEQDIPIGFSVPQVCEYSTLLDRSVLAVHWMED
jgi:hypothetical protein